MAEEPARPGGAALPAALHLTPAEIWERQTEAAVYLPERFDQDGFIHCTEGEQNLLAAGNRYYRDDPRAYVVLTIALGRVSEPVVYEDPARIYPHICGPLRREAIVDVHRVVRSRDGAFTSVDGIV